MLELFFHDPCLPGKLPDKKVKELSSKGNEYKDNNQGSTLRPECFKKLSRSENINAELLQDNSTNDKDAHHCPTEISRGMSCPEKDWVNGIPEKRAVQAAG